MSRAKEVSLAATVAAVVLGMLVLPASAQAAGETISGNVTDSNGDPVEGYCVMATEFDGGSRGLPPVRTEANGDYEISVGMEPGIYKVEFALCQNGPQGPASNLRLLREYWDDKPTQGEADFLTISEGEAATGIDAELTIGAEISGRVLGPDGEPVVACVDVYGPGTAHTVVTNETGEFLLRQRRSGDYVVRVDDCGFDGGLATEWYDNKATESVADTVVLAVAEQRNLGDIQLSEGGTIQGTVTDASGNPLRRICVDFYDEDGEYYDQTRTEDDGTYIRHGFFPADYRIHFSDCDYKANVLPEYHEDAGTLAEAEPLTIAEGETETVDAQLARGGSISGVVRGPDQMPLEGACVYVYGDEEDTYVTSTDTDDNGRWSIVSLLTGSYRVHFYSCSTTPETLEEYWNDKPELEEADPISVTAGLDTPNINATLGAPDPLDPETTITSGPSEGAVVANPVTFGFESDMAGSSFECRLDDAAFAACTSPRELSGLGSGEHAFEVRAISPVGLTDPTPASRSFSVEEESSDACDDARAELRAAERAQAKAKKKLKKAKRALAKAKRKGSAKKIKKAKKIVKKAKREKRSARRAVRAAQRAVDRACGP